MTNRGAVGAAFDNGDSDVKLFLNVPQSGNNPGDIHVAYWMGQTDDAVTDMLKYFAGNAL